MTCRACGSLRLETVLDVGAVAAADRFPSATAPIAATRPAIHCRWRCAAPVLWPTRRRRHRRRRATWSRTAALKDQAEAAVADVAEAGLLVGSSVVEFGSPHGGTWMPLLADRGFTGRPASGTTPTDVVLDCFGMMHEPDQAAAVARRARATARDGVLLFQFHSLATIVRQGQWNALRHGHFAYYSLTALRSLFDAVGCRSHRRGHTTSTAGRSSSPSATASTSPTRRSPRSSPTRSQPASPTSPRVGAAA